MDVNVRDHSRHKIRPLDCRALMRLDKDRGHPATRRFSGKVDVIVSPAVDVRRTMNVKVDGAFEITRKDQGWLRFVPNRLGRLYTGAQNCLPPQLSGSGEDSVIENNTCDIIRGFPAHKNLSMRIRILYHDHCFDGAASAAFFTRFMRDKFHPGAEFLYTGMAHKASQIFEDALFDGDENAIVDFKYSANPRLTWWFDHHQSAFLSPEDAEQYKRTRTEKKLYDPSFRSCTRLIQRVSRDKWAYDATDLHDLVHWAEIIDGALYNNAKEAVDLGAPAMQLTLSDRGIERVGYRSENHTMDAVDATGRDHAAARNQGSV